MATKIRLEPRMRTNDLSDALEARIHDPLWLLARQWQFGEFLGSDGGSPAVAELEYETALVDRFSSGPPGSAAAQAYDPTTTPLEAVVEAEQMPASTDRDYSWVVEGGLHFLRMLGAYNAAKHARAFRELYKLTADSQHVAMFDDTSRKFVEIASGRVPDARELFRAFSPIFGARGERDGVLPARPAIPAADVKAVKSAIRGWLRWYATQGVFARADTPAWVDERMEYAFALGARAGDGDVALTAPEYAGSLDWQSFQVDAGRSLAPHARSPETTTRRFVPGGVVYRGMPSPRFWELEDARVAFGATRRELDQQSVGALLVLEYALVFGNDWFLVPLELAVGSVSRVTRLAVHDTFGDRVEVEPAGKADAPRRDWRMFALSGDPRPPHKAPLLFLPPVLGPRLSGEPVEDVLLVRDEMANIAWGIERTVTSLAGLPLDRFEEQEARRRGVTEQGQPSAPGGVLRYRLGSPVPEHWIPLVPEHDAATGTTRLRRARVPAAATTTARPGAARGRLLVADVRLYDEEVPREGVRVTRAYQWARWSDGAPHLWIGRRKRPGRGEASSGLRFDYGE